jgi:hypothetical protein
MECLLEMDWCHVAAQFCGCRSPKSDPTGQFLVVAKVISK